MSRLHGSNRSAFYRAPSHILQPPKRGWRSLFGNRWTTTAAASACVLALVVYLSGGRQPQRGPAYQADVAEMRRSERLQHGRVQRRYITGAALTWCFCRTRSYRNWQHDGQQHRIFTPGPCNGMLQLLQRVCVS